MATFINPFTKVGFKRIFGQEFSKPVLIHFLNNLFQGELTIVDLEFSDQEPATAEGEYRPLISDVYCKLDTGEKIIVEMNPDEGANCINRSIYYISECIVRLEERSFCSHFPVKAVYLITFLNGKSPDLGKKLRTHVVLMHGKTKKVYTDFLNLIYLQLPYFEQEADLCKNDFERWIYVLKHMETCSQLPWSDQHPAFRQLAEIANVHALSQEEKEKHLEDC